MTSRRRYRGFTLVEIMIVVAIIVLVAAIAIPNLLRARLNSNEASAISSMRVITGAAITYRGVNPGFPTNLTVLSNAVPAYLDTFLAGGLKQGYNFTLIGTTNNFNITGVPVTPNVTGIRGFYSDASGIIRASSTGTANASSPPIQ